MSDTKRPPARRRWLELRKPVSRTQAILSGILIWTLFFAVWEGVSLAGLVNDLLVPAPHEVLATLGDMLANRGLVSDILISVWRVVFSFSIACAVAIPLGIAMGAFPSVEAVFNPFVSAWRYLPAPSFIPILLMWFGTGETPKIALLIIGVIFFLITLIMDHTRQVRAELVETGLTLGAGRWTIVRTIIFPAVMPNILTAMRQMLAVTWTYLVIAEIVASTTGIGAMMMRARRFLHTDEIMAGIIVIGILGLGFDILFRMLHRWLFPYTQERGS
ncbi:ABC transporter permease [Roseovarius spongiae]|uniref:ABC transporter permease n=1 Tax=Roseovarius spongiae TaxID=2320272 RepID=A0A3A8B736_9RHOB|nr:ABC transporter permease [Roseovarius spongiae]RKF17235.1 ABC transporter permease [Roseovarius spongiae]